MNKDQVNLSPREMAQKALQQIAVKPTGLVSYQSAGHVVAIGDTENRKRWQDFLSANNIEWLVTNNDASNIQIQGYLGNFDLLFTDEFGNPARQKADAVVDLFDKSILSAELLPAGYFTCPQNSQAEDLLIEELAAITGEFEKPRYFDYDASICAHAVNGRAVCRACIDACPAEAIISIGEKVEVNPHLCQGGGTCTSACPSGAMSYRYPAPRDSSRRLRVLLQTYRENSGSNAVVVFQSEESTSVLDKPNQLAVMVEELASVGPEICLAALAYGAEKIVFLADHAIPQKSTLQIQKQLQWLNVIAEANGFDADAIQLVESVGQIPSVNSAVSLLPAVQDMPDSKRDAFFLALDHLVDAAKSTEVVLSLPAPAPFGTVDIDAQKCTLCMACISACPAKALQNSTDRDFPSVQLIESNCLQCSACVQTCPEQAMEITPRLIFEREVRNRQTELNRDTPFACIVCSKPFAPATVIEKMQDKLKDHYMFDNARALDRLKMCDNCRVADIVQDPDALNGQFDPVKHNRH